VADARERFLTYCAEQGLARESLLRTAREVLIIAIDLTTGKAISIHDVEAAADRWGAHQHSIMPNSRRAPRRKNFRVFQESESFVQPGTRLLEIGDPRDLEMEIDVLSTDAVKIKPGDKVLVEHWGSDAPLLGRVRLIEPAAFLKISALGVEEQRVNVIADFVDPPEKRRALGDAYRIEARIVISEADNVLKVPAAALFRRGEEWAVFVADHGRASLRAIKIGRRNDLEAEVVGGVLKTRMFSFIQATKFGMRLAFENAKTHEQKSADCKGARIGLADPPRVDPKRP
jgi:HlyD family secretion protein